MGRGGLGGAGGERRAGLPPVLAPAPEQAEHFGQSLHRAAAGMRLVRRRRLLGRGGRAVHGRVRASKVEPGGRARREVGGVVGSRPDVWVLARLPSRVSQFGCREGEGGTPRSTYVARRGLCLFEAVVGKGVLPLVPSRDLVAPVDDALVTLRGRHDGRRCSLEGRERRRTRPRQLEPLTGPRWDERGVEGPTGMVQSMENAKKQAEIRRSVKGTRKPKLVTEMSRS